MEEVRSMMGDGPVYISFDIDGLDPAFAPGTGMIKLIFHRREVTEERKSSTKSLFGCIMIQYRGTQGEILKFLHNG